MMDPIYIDLQRALDECREKIADRIWEESADSQSFHQLRQTNTEAIAKDTESWKAEALFWQEECLYMRESVSWKITKPLRLVKMTWASLCGFGLQRTMTRIGKYIRRTP